MLLSAGACCTRHRGLEGSVRIHVMQDVADFQQETDTWQPSKKTPEMHYCCLLTEQHDFQMKAKCGPHCFISYLPCFNNTRLLLFSAELNLQ